MIQYIAVRREVLFPYLLLMYTFRAKLSATRVISQSTQSPQR
jgi:hypothetical protein